MMQVIGFVLLILPCVLSKYRYITSYGGICTSLCDQHDESYYWCWQKGYLGSTWDYCSPEENYDYTYNECQSDCKRGSKYRWCRIKGGSWGYCGHITEEFDTHYTIYGEECVTDCNIKGHFECVDSNNHVEYCSPANDVTYQGEPCRNDHPCNSYGYSYTWCYTDEHNNWDYCGIVKSDCDKSFHISHRNKRQSQEEICRIADTGNQYLTIFSAVRESQFITPTRNQFMEASNIINRITAETVFVPGTMYTSNNIRLDVQGDLKDGVTYFNLQLQIKVLRRGQSNISQALIPQNLDVSHYFRYIRRALQTSLRGAYHGNPVQILVIIQRI